MSYIGIGSPIPEIVNLPGQTGGEVTVTLDYPSSAVCASASPFSPSEATPSGGTFAATPSGLTINASTGEVTPSTSTPQAYTISYTVSGVTSQFALTVNAVQQSTFSYSSSSFQQIGTATPTLADGTTAGGTFTADTGVSINASTGVIDLAASTIGGPYTITYTTPGPCATSSTFDISITAVVIELIDNDFAMEFNGTDEYISAGNPTELQFTSDFSISGWFKSSSATSQRIVSKDDGTNRSYLVQLQSNGVVRGTVFKSGSGQNNDSSSGFADGDWHHFVFTFENGVGTKLYIDNGTPTVNASANAVDNDPSIFTIGTRGDGLNYFNGDIDEIAVWNKVLDATDVQRIYNATNDNPGKTANLWSAGLNTGLVYWNRMGD